MRNKEPEVEQYLSRLKMRKEGIDFCILQRRRFGPVEYIEFQPGNGTRYLLVFSFMDEPGVHKNFKYYSGGCDVVVSLVTETKGRTITFSRDMPPHYAYLMEKMSLLNGDAMVLEELIEHVLETTKGGA